MCDARGTCTGAAHSRGASRTTPSWWAPKYRHRRSIVLELCFWFAQRDVHWSRAFTGRITDDTKLVGATISCESTLKDGDAKKGSRQNAHVQSYAMATDQVQART